MKIGMKIKEYRQAKELTQKDLAGLLNVTYQAVSRWENDDVEPSFDTLVKLCEIFGCTLDDLFGREKPAEEADDAPASEEIPPAPAPAIPEPPKPVLCLCEKCNEPIFNKEDIHRYTQKVGKTGSVTHVLCPSCAEKHKQAVARAKREAQRAEGEKLRSRRSNSFVWATVVAVALMIIAIVLAVKGKLVPFGVLLACSILSFTFVATMILDNTFLPDMWLEIASWGFVKMPGVIMEFSLGGFIVGIAIKIFLWILGFALAAAAIVFATALGMILSPFTYPFALRKNIRETKAALGK